MSEFSRVSVSESLRRTIEDIKEIAGQHSDEDIHAMLKECNMDPNETAQKLLYLDTFHEVKRKRDRRKVVTQRRGSRGGGSRYSSAGRTGRQPNVSMGRDSKSLVSVEQKERNSYTSAAYNGSPIHEWNSQIAEQNIKGAAKETKNVCDGTSKRLPSLRAISVKHIANIDPGPTPTSTPTIASTARTPGGNLKPKCNQVGNSVGLYSSATDPVLEPSLNPRNPASVGIIQRETGNQRNASEISVSLLEDSKISGVHNATFGQGSVGVTSETQPVEYKGVGSSQSESTRLPSSTTHPTAAVAKGHQETCLVQPDNTPSKGMSEAVVVSSETNLHSLSTVEDPSPDITTSEVDVKLHSDRHSVIFPNNLYVPEAFKNSIMFGSLESSLQESNGSSPTDASNGIDIEVSKEPSVIPQSSSSVSGCSDYLDRPPAPPHVLVDIKPSQENAVSLRYGQSKEEILQPIGGSHNPPATSDYGLKLVPPAVQLETQGGNSVVLSTSSTPTMTQPRGIPQGSIAALSPPQIYPYLRQTYPANYIPYNPYYSQLYMPPQHAHQLLSHSGFPHQPSAGNIYMPPTSAAPGAKLPVPPPSYKPGNMTHYGISSGYSSYGTSGLGYGSTGAHDNSGTELKDKNIYSTIKQNEDMHVLHDPSGVQTNMVYNVPQAYQAAGRSSFGGIYHQSMAGPRSVHQPQHATGEVALNSYSSQSQQQLLPLPQHYGQMNRRENV